ncbi:hypothetical protein B2J69_10250 [Pantoea latae]|uniref:Uncharacterized protein n=1 Tax=Pantoea latae TaxID=1964541 RepID=A0A1V9DJA8_9GAMM|nr:hypothetical protein B2J69_10250 [Pantoea latae]
MVTRVLLYGFARLARAIFLLQAARRRLAISDGGIVILGIVRLVGHLIILFREFTFFIIFAGDIFYAARNLTIVGKGFHIGTF